MKINFAKYLLEILLEQGKVDVPGLGKFILERKPASFGEGRQSLKAPHQEIVFQESHDSDDTQLQDRIAKKEGGAIDSVKAGEFVNQFTSDVLKGLMDNKEVEIAYVGVIKRGVDEQINFTQNQATIDKLNKYMPEVELPKQQKLEPIEKEPEAKVVQMEKPIVQKPIVDTEKASSIRTDIQPEPTNTYVEPEKSGFAWVKWLLGVLAMIVLITLLFKMCGKEDPTAYKTNQAEEEIASNETSEDEIEVNDIQSVDENFEETNGDSESIEENDVNSDDSSSEDIEIKSASDFNKEQCIVIIGSYQSNKNVRSASSKIEREGYLLYTESHGAYTRVGVKINCDEIQGSYSSFVQKISREFGVNAWFLSPEVKQ